MKNSNLYLPAGWLNIEEIDRIADREGIYFIIIIGKRQVGKTYGTLRLMLDKDRFFMLMRRTATEAQFIASDVNNPFRNFRDREIKIENDTKYTSKIMDGVEDPRQIGTLTALSAVAKMRGFDGSAYTDLVYDEFIPERHVQLLRGEGDAFLNAVVTISGNRELEGKKPLRCWLLANSNNISSPILDALNAARKVADMSASGQEISVMPEKATMIILPASEKVTDARKKTVLMKAVSDDSSFAQMALGNRFAYNDFSGIRENVNLKEYVPIFRVVGAFTVYQHKTAAHYYVCSRMSAAAMDYEDTERQRVLVQRRYPSLRPAYFGGSVIFSDIIVKNRFIDFLGLI